MHRALAPTWLVALALAGCGSVHGGATPDASGPGDDSGGGACTTNDQCAAPTPVCDPGNGCVECLQSDQCPADKPTCDTSTHTCRECAVDADCDSNVCDPEAGACVAEANVLYASPTGPDAGTCPKSSPCSIAQAAAVADQTRNNVKLASGAYTAHIILTNKTLVFYGVGATVAAPGTNPVFEVDDGAHLRVVGASLSAAGGAALRCEGAASATHILELFQATVDNTSTIMLANPCTVTVAQSVLRSSTPTDFHEAIVGPSVATFDRTQFVGNGGSGLVGISNASITITNSELTDIGVPSATNHGAFVGASFNVSFSTIIDGVVECSSQGATGLTLDSSIVFNTAAGAPADTMPGLPACTSVTNSLIFPNSQPVGLTNVKVDPQLKNVGAGDYHLTVASPALDLGNPASTNKVDFDGTVRPQGAGPDSGAFEFKP
jgi:hypothetical protein